MRTFNPNRGREDALEGKLPRVLNRQYEPKYSMENIASCDLEQVIYAWLAGLGAEIASVIPRSRKWIDKSIINKEYN